ncbi:transposable element Tc1 transposase [Trichonephila clavipes]|nr:transposable element Tc1 transposase [Trichonephila clavipes]
MGGGGLMVCECMAASGVGNIVVINGIMDLLHYIQILKENLCASTEKLGIKDYQFYQDNDLKHSAQNARLWLLYNCPKVIKTPPKVQTSTKLSTCGAYWKKD